MGLTPFSSRGLFGLLIISYMHWTWQIITLQRSVDSAPDLLHLVGNELHYSHFYKNVSPLRTLSGISFSFKGFGDQRNVSLLRALNGFSFPFKGFGDRWRCAFRVWEWKKVLLFLGLSLSLFTFPPFCHSAIPPFSYLCGLWVQQIIKASAPAPYTLV